jgi:hypothetical protein
VSVRSTINAARHSHHAYLDPPFNSRQDYNVLFAEKDGTRSSSQIMAFEDTWEWKAATHSKRKSKSHTKEGCPTLPRFVRKGGRRECTFILNDG